MRQVVMTFSADVSEDARSYVPSLHFVNAITYRVSLKRNLLSDIMFSEEYIISLTIMRIHIITRMLVAIHYVNLVSTMVHLVSNAYNTCRTMF